MTDRTSGITERSPSGLHHHASRTSLQKKYGQPFLDAVVETVDAWMPTAPMIPSEWTEQAKCKGLGTDLFYSEIGAYAEATKFCSDCPVRVECLATALVDEWGVDDIKAIWGIWGGVTRAQRLTFRDYIQRRRAAA